MLTWGVTDGSAGTIAQVRALAQALGLAPEMKAVTVRQPWAGLPNICFAGGLKRLVVPYMIGKGSDALSPPWPELVISCGRRAAIVAMGLQAKLSARQEGRGTRFIHIQDPQVGARHFDLVVAMEHDRISGPNVIRTRYALHAVTPQLLGQAKWHFGPRFGRYKAPYIAVLLGGSTNKYTLAPEAMAQVVMALQRLLSATTGSLLITPSRRTGEANIAMLRQVFAANPRVYIYDFAEENPYLGMLAVAETLVVSNDSVNMMSEAYATGKPLYILRLPGHEDTKPARFAEALIDKGIARPVGGKIETWDYPVDNEMGRLAEEISQRLALSAR